MDCTDKPTAGQAAGSPAYRTRTNHWLAVIGAALLALGTIAAGCNVCSNTTPNAPADFKDRPSPVYEFVPPIE